MQRRGLILLAIGLALAALTGVLIAVSLGGDGDGSAAGDVLLGSAYLTGIPQQGTALGDAGAPRTLVVYADLQCPFCRDWDEGALPGILDEHVRDGDLRLAFHGLAFIGPESELGLRGVLAAGLQDRLWNLVNVIYANQGAENAGWLTEDSLRRFGEAVPGLDVDRMMDDLDAAEVDRLMADAQSAAESAGVTGTPSFELGPTGGELELVSGAELDGRLAG